MRLRLGSLVAATVCGTSLGIAGAQQQPVQQQPGVTLQVPGVGLQIGGQPVAGQVVQQPHGVVNDHSLASCLAIGNQEEIDLAKFGEEKTKNKEVKDFVQMISKDHQEYLKKLARFAPEATRDGYLIQTQVTANRVAGSGETVATEAPRNTVSGKTQPQGENVNRRGNEVRETVATTATQPAGSDFMQLHRELAQECLSQSKQNLSKKDSDKFDECFMTMQVFKHYEMKDKLAVFQRHAGPELSKVIAEGLETTETHLKKAERILTKLHDSDDDNKTTSTDK